MCLIRLAKQRLERKNYLRIRFQRQSELVGMSESRLLLKRLALKVLGFQPPGFAGWLRAFGLRSVHGPRTMVFWCDRFICRFGFGIATDHTLQGFGVQGINGHGTPRALVQTDLPSWKQTPTDIGSVDTKRMNQFLRLGAPPISHSSTEDRRIVSTLAYAAFRVCLDLVSSCPSIADTLIWRGELHHVCATSDPAREPVVVLHVSKLLKGLVAGKDRSQATIAALLVNHQQGSPRVVGCLIALCADVVQNENARRE